MDKRIPNWVIKEADKFYLVHKQQRERIAKIEAWMESKGIDVDSACAVGDIDYNTPLEMGMLANGEMDGEQFAQMITSILDEVKRRNA